MLIAALVDGGAPEAVLQEVPERLGLTGVELVLTRVERQGIGALHLRVLCEQDVEERSWRSIREQLAAADLDGSVAARAEAVFSRLADAEGRVHGVPPEEVHFHELGAVDTLIDVVGTVTLLSALGIKRLVCSPLPLGRGTTRAAHGVLPLPAPATAVLLEGAPVVGVAEEFELVTPTGAALAATLADGWGTIPEMTLERVGYGAGTADLPTRPNLVRILLGSRVASAIAQRPVSLLETNLDDFSPELVPDAMERCFAAGALDVWTTPAMMKKSRPGFVLAALARPDAEASVARALLEETSALGVRVSTMRRFELEREERTVEVAGHRIRIKVGRLDGRVVNVAPEHDDCAAVAAETGTSAKTVWAAALAAAGELR
jgi:uncharacterized protein (TIGR00299 family) protein